MTQPSPNRLNQAYSILSGDDNTERLCKAIPEAACTHLPKNYLLNIANGSATKLAEQVAGPNLVLPWLLNALGAPVWLIGLLMPIKQAASLLPQLAVSGYIRQFPMRKWFWVGAGTLQALCLWLMIAAALMLTPLAAGLSIVILLGIFSAASGMGSVAFQDVVGKTIPKGNRGRLLAHRATIGGLLAIATGLLLKMWLGTHENLSTYLGLLGLGGVLWGLGALCFALTQEEAGATAGGRNPIDEARAGWQLFQQQRGYRQYLYSRTLLVCIEIAAPFYVILGQQQFSVGSFQLFSALLIAIGLAQVLSSPFWGRFADTSSRRVMVYSNALGTVAAVFALIFSVLPDAWQNVYSYGLVFIILGFAEAGARLGRKTYLVDAVDGTDRATYVAFANSGIGALTLLMGALGILGQLLGMQGLIAVLALLGIVGVFISLRMPEAEAMLSHTETHE